MKTVKISNFIYYFFGVFLILINPFFSQKNYASSDFNRLKLILEKYNFSVLLKLPPQTGTYGLLDTKNRTIYINPVVFELKIAEPTLVHESVHAAQLCANSTPLKPLYLGLEYPKIVYPYFMRYSGDRRHIEAEAYTIQSRSDSIDYVINLLDKYCPSPSKKYKVGVNGR